MESMNETELMAVCEAYSEMVNKYIEAICKGDITGASDIRINHLKPLEKCLRYYELYKSQTK